MKLALYAILALSVFAQTKPSPDLCVPPPSGTAPMLPAKIMEGMGTEYVHLQITTSNPKAQQFFDQGLAQLHSFWALEAERSFRQAAELDPEAPMPWFGVALAAAEYRPRFQIDQLSEAFGRDPRGFSSRAADAAKKAQELAAVDGKATDLEKMYIAAAVARRVPSGRDVHEAYIDALRTLIAKYPKEIEARTFLALHLMRGFELPDRTPRPGSMEAAYILRQLMKEAPDHPGVHHYVIHGFEGSTFAKDAWHSCERYAQVVWNIPHALHMPGHIYSQTGKFEEGEKAFASAAVNEMGRMKADSLYGSSHHGHNVHYLSTTYAFNGKYDQAKDAARSLLAIAENPREKANLDANNSAYRQGWFALMRALLLSENWDEILDGKTLPVYDRPRENAWRHWLTGVAFAAKGDAARATESAHQMDAVLKDYENVVKRKPPVELTIAREELNGHILAAQGKTKQALETLESASRNQRKLRYSEPPYYPRPVSEAIGETALRAGKLPEAESAFRVTLEDLPASARSVAGLAEVRKRSAKASGAAAEF
jgi:tetratricopeptide (TPR) repeat protein